jgi:hypothetical protein
MVLLGRDSMGQHFLLSAAARSLSAAKIMRMSDREVENVFLLRLSTIGQSTAMALQGVSA